DPDRGRAHRGPGSVGGGVAGACEGSDRRVEIPAMDRMRGPVAEDGDRQDPALSPAGGVMRPGWLSLPEGRIETAWWGPDPSDAPTIVLLHEGLGCVALWRDVPERLASMTGLGVFAYSRFGYGQSDLVTLPRPMTYMHHEGQVVLPQ